MVQPNPPSKGAITPTSIETGLSFVPTPCIAECNITCLIPGVDLAVRNSCEEPVFVSKVYIPLPECLFAELDSILIVREPYACGFDKL